MMITWKVALLSLTFSATAMAGLRNRYGPPLPHMYRTLLGPDDNDQPPSVSRRRDDDVRPLLQRQQDEDEVSDPSIGWREDDNFDDYPIREFNKKMIQPVRFNEARFRPIYGRIGIAPSNRENERPTSITPASSQVRENNNNDESEDDERRKKKDDAPEGLWMKKKRKRSRSITLKKREGRLSAQEQQKLLGELGNILKDDDKESKKTGVLTSNVKRQANVSALKAETSDQKPSSSSEDHQNFEDWLKQEYLRNMALSFATAKKKKRSPIKSGDELRKKRKATGETDNDADLYPPAGLAREFYDPETLDAVKERLKVIENAVLADAIQKIILRGARDDSVSEATGVGSQKIANRLAEAYYIEKLKQNLDKLPHNWGKFREEDEYADEMDRYQKRGGDVNLVDALSVMAPADDKRQPEREEALEADEFEVCPELQLLTSDCSALEGFLPNSPMAATLRHFCNKHEVCYTCGEAFGLTSSDCDGLFLRDTMTLCRASGLCQGDGDLLLQPLHERRVFYKRSVPPICYRAPCVRNFLLE